MHLSNCILHNTAKTHSLLGAGGYKLKGTEKEAAMANREVTADLYFTEVGAVGYAEYETAGNTIFMFEPEWLETTFSTIPPYLTITVSAEEQQGQGQVS
jgi:hypothetical protein